MQHRDPARIAWARELLLRFPPDPDAPEGAVESVIRTRQSILMETLPQDLFEGLDEERLEVVRELDLTSYMCVAMTTPGRTFGAMVFASAESRRKYTAADLALAEHLARRGGLAIENARVHRDIARERAKLESIVSSVRYGICHVDAGGAVTYINAATTELLGIQEEEAIGARICPLMHGPACALDVCPLREASVGRPFQGREDFQTAAGSTVPIELLASPIVFDDRIDGAVLVFQDISERLRDERAKDDFVAFASHELKSPLTPVLGMAHWLSRKSSSSPERYDEDDREAIETLTSEAERLARVVDTFLDLSRIDAGHLQLDHEPMEVGATVEAEVNSLRQRHPQAVIHSLIPDEPIHALSDEIRFRQVLANLLENAVKYGGDDCSEVNARVTRDERHCYITVTDNGPGISPLDQPYLFDRFYRSERDSVQRKKGLGIGLFITRQIVDAAGGSITVSSTSDEGTTFAVTWPLRPPLTLGDIVTD